MKYRKNLEKENLQKFKFVRLGHITPLLRFDENNQAEMSLVERSVEIN